MSFNPIILVDFDGVIHSYTSGWKGISTIPDGPVGGAIEFLMANLPEPEDIDPFGASHQRFKLHSLPIVQIYSSRSKSWFGRRAMKKWLIKHGLPKGYIRDGILKFPKQKPAAFLTIDDRAMCFNGKFPSVDEMKGFKPWYKVTPGDGSIPISEGWLHDIKGALKDPGNTSLRDECLEFIDSKLKADIK